jgi:hypothetical protein
MEGKYTIELFCEGGEGAGIERVLDRHDDLATARAIYRWHTLYNPGRLVLLCVGARVLVRSDSLNKKRPPSPGTAKVEE